MTVNDHINKLPPILRLDMDKNLCSCNEVLKSDVIIAIVNGANTVEEIRQQTYATGGNGCCTRQVKRLIECLSDNSSDRP